MQSYNLVHARLDLDYVTPAFDLAVASLLATTRTNTTQLNKH
jgi:hypothetical protein